MRPYFRNASVTLYYGDWRDLELRGDLLLTDPPYGVGEDDKRRQESRSCLAESGGYPAISWDTAPSRKDLERLLEIAPKAIVWGGNHLDLPTGEPGWLVWDKENGENDFADCELAWSNLGTAVRRIAFRWHGMIRGERGSRVHPTQKPRALMRWCIERARLEDGAVVVDPYAGSGTTLVAAMESGLRAIGVEREEAYCEAAAKRLSQGFLWEAGR